MNRACADQRGFTLIEVLIALALMALLSIISWRALDLVGRSSERLNASADDTLALVRALGQIESDIGRHASSDILPPAAQDGVMAAGTGATGPGAGAAAASPNVLAAAALLPPGIHWSAPVLTVLRSAHDGAWQQVVWGQVGHTLRRAAGTAAHVLPLPQAEAGQVVLDHVSNFTVRAWVPGQGWAAPEAVTASRLAATGLEIVIERQRGGVAEAYRKVVLLP